MYVCVLVGVYVSLYVFMCLGATKNDGALCKLAYYFFYKLQTSKP